eukprot:TRINITY_DN4049_c0_g4_i1.p1 TRINITY_DN4049_c0_g4~~TRINITY_DN4049_c0_g4_i1.p1  ORF type:complete len:800 (+),score=152.26 TRINITY_DN4049_c0_g4_i1:81-2480(+)
MSSLRVLLYRNARTLLPSTLRAQRSYSTLLLKRVSGCSVSAGSVCSLKTRNKNLGFSNSVFVRYKHQTVESENAGNDSEYAEELLYFKRIPGIKSASILLYLFKNKPATESVVSSVAQIYQTLLEHSISPDPTILRNVMFIFNNYDPQLTFKIYDDIEKYGLECDEHVWQNLTYAVFRTLNLPIATKLLNHFTQMKRSVILTPQMCNNLFTVFTHHAKLKEALELYEYMKTHSIPLNKGCFVDLFKVFTNTGPEGYEHGKKLYTLWTNSQLAKDENVANHVLQMFLKCEGMKKAIEVFETFPKIDDPFVWNNMINACLKNGENAKAIAYFKRAVAHNVLADEYTFSGVLMAIANLGPSGLKTGENVHKIAIQKELEFEPAITSSLIQMYDRCEDPHKALEIFEKFIESGHLPNDIILISTLKCCVNIGPHALDTGIQIHKIVKVLKLDSSLSLCNALMQMYDKCGKPSQALKIFDGLAAQYVIPDSLSFVVVLGACSSIGPSALRMGEEIHNLINKREFKREIIITNALMKMYTKCGNPSKAFDFISQGYPTDEATLNLLLTACFMVGPSALELGKQIHNEIVAQKFDSNSTLIGSLIKMYASVGQPHQAIKVFDDSMKNKNFIPNQAAYVSLLMALTSMGSKGLLKGKQAHEQIKQKKYDRGLSVVNSLLQMYEKCGDQNMAIVLYDELKEHGLTPDEFTFAIVLSCLSKVGPSALENGKRVHADFANSPFTSNVSITNALIHMYSECGETNKAIELYDALMASNGKPNELTFSHTLFAISKLEKNGLVKGAKVHQQM